jgi:Phage tail tube protein
MLIKIGDPLVPASNFSVAALNGWAEIDPTRAITATLLPLRRHSFTPAANTATGVTLRILTSAYFQNWPYGHTNHSRRTSQLELETPNVGTGDAASFRYAKGLAVSSWKINAPLKNKVTIEMSTVGLDMPDPVLQAGRPADTATFLDPLDARMFDTTSDMKYIALRRASNNVALVDEINAWTADIDLEIKPQEIQGVLGANSHIHGKFRPSLNIDAYHKTDEVAKAVRSNPDVYFMAILGNEDGGFGFNMPAGKLRNDEESYDESDAVMLKIDMPAHREQTTNRAASVTLFGYVGQL